MSAHDLRRVLFRCASILLTLPSVCGNGSIFHLEGADKIFQQCDYELLHYLVAVPFESLTPASISTGMETWIWLLQERPDLEISLMLEINSAWLSVIQQKRGMFSATLK